MRRRPRLLRSSGPADRWKNCRVWLGIRRSQWKKAKGRAGQEPTENIRSRARRPSRLRRISCAAVSAAIVLAEARARRPRDSRQDAGATVVGSALISFQLEIFPIETSEGK